MTTVVVITARQFDQLSDPDPSNPGCFRVNCFNCYRRIMRLPNDEDALVQWTRTAYMLTCDAADEGKA